MMGFQAMGPATLIGLLAMVLAVAGVIVLIVGAIGMSGTIRRGDDALQILRARFARGEIEAEEFDRARTTLGQSRRVPAANRAVIVGIVLLVAGILLGQLGWSWSGFGGTMGPGNMGMMGMMRPAPTAPAGTSVTMAGARFAPATLSIRAGDTVRWFNDDMMPHTVTASDRGFDSGYLAPGTSFERRFDASGTYPYVCVYHPWMTATVEVAPR